CDGHPWAPKQDRRRRRGPRGHCRKQQPEVRATAGALRIGRSRVPDGLRGPAARRLHRLGLPTRMRPHAHKLTPSFIAASFPGPMPRTSMSCSTERNGPLASRHSTIALAVAGPTPSSVSSCAASAELMLIFPPAPPPPAAPPAAPPVGVPPAAPPDEPPAPAGPASPGRSI